MVICVSAYVVNIVNDISSFNRYACGDEGLFSNFWPGRKIMI